MATNKQLIQCILWKMPQLFHQILWRLTGYVLVSVFLDNEFKTFSHFIWANRYPFIGCNYGLTKQLFKCEE